MGQRDVGEHHVYPCRTVRDVWAPWGLPSEHELELGAVYLLGALNGVLVEGIVFVTTLLEGVVVQSIQVCVEPWAGGRILEVAVVAAVAARAVADSSIVASFRGSLVTPRLGSCALRGGSENSLWGKEAKHYYKHEGPYQRLKINEV